MKRFRLGCTGSEHRLHAGNATVGAYLPAGHPVNLQPTPARPSFRHTLPDTCRFDLLQIDALKDPSSGRIVHLYSLVARCHGCAQVFTAHEGAGFISTSVARILRCPEGCGEHALRPRVLRDWQPAAA
ncbi:hypothetical protein [Stenotrophomonas sp. ZAC14D2_NAIMI4_7]|uniref:hypothetical protein n=1 Tax=Stenotrophomonas sp. ZAC14D2_NAIMI4_7 TaxID=2072405 RepID=UPI002D7780A3|nr:hypothetical protein [Stenotrophomonas sp. ZAC14D2_NAIMI4_7]